MKATVAVSLLAAAAVHAHALPNVEKREGGIDDTTVLNFALTLEHLENNFYQTALAQYSQEDFVAAGLPVWARGRFVEIGKHEQIHVDTLKSVLGAAATQPCTYEFPMTDAKSFAALSGILEGVGTSAYAGAAQYLSSKDALNAAAVILSTEARHAAWVESAVRKENPWSGAFDTALTPNEVYTLASAFIKACPESNPPLPFKAFPALALGKGQPGSTVSVTTADSSSGQHYVAFFSGLETKFAPVQDGKVTIPAGLFGTVYAVLTNSDSAAKDENTLAGPAILSFAYNSRGEYIHQQ